MPLLCKIRQPFVRTDHLDSELVRQLDSCSTLEPRKIYRMYGFKSPSSLHQI